MRAFCVHDAGTGACPCLVCGTLLPCGTLLLVWPHAFTASTWKAFCNETDIWFENYDNEDCSGKSILTRDYVTNKCVNCPLSDPVNCKNGPFPF